MKSIYLSSIAILFVLLTTAQTPIENWSGILNAGGQKIELRLHLKHNADNTYSASWDVPIQKAIGIPASKTSLSNNKLSVEIKMIGAGYEGTITDKGDKIEGTWNQSGMNFPLNFTPFQEGQAAAVATKPQTPKPPFNYEVNEFTYQGQDTKLTYGATITYPKDNTKHPLVILITGSGKQDRDESIFDHKPFAVLADYLTRKGFVVMRVDDRGAGKSTGNFNNSTTADFALDVEEHINYAKKLSMVDSNKIGLLGHSEGGLIAPMVAARNSSVAFIILMAGPAIPIIDLMALQNEKVLKSVGIAPAAIEAYLPLYRQIMKSVIAAKDKQDAIEQANTLTKDWFQKTDKAFVKGTTNISTEADINHYATSMAETLSTPWWKFFASYDPQPTLLKLQCPVLALNGTADIQVPANENLTAMESIFKKSGNSRVSIQIMEGMNHLFQKCTACTVAEYGQLETTMEPAVLELLGKWLVANVK